MDFFTAYALTVSTESVVLFLLLRREHGAALIARNAVIASSLTLPFVWFVFQALGLGWSLQTALAEAFAAIVEAGFFALAFRGITARNALLSSVLCNWASFIIGLSLS